MDLFDDLPADKPEEDGLSPLAVCMRPRTLDEFVGQRHFIGPGKLLSRMLQADRRSSLIFYGPPGTGKTSLAYVIANLTQAHFEQINAAASSTRQVREIIAGAQSRRRRRGKRTVLFVDELHRFNKAQQDVLLSDVEDGTIILIGATTHNPFFAINAPLVSRSQLFHFEPLDTDDIKTLIHQAASDTERGLGRYNVRIDDDALDFLAEICDGDARRALNALEVGVFTTEPEGGAVHYTLPVAEDSIQQKALRYDRNEDDHYDAASAFIKSMRGSDPDAALYWMARMLEAGEDPRFIARRMVICASEDVGNAAPLALVLATSALHGVEFVGMPEAKLILSQAVTYIATAPKSNASTIAIGKAIEDVQNGRVFEVPKHLRDANYPGAKRLGHGDGYKYSHSYSDHYVPQDYLPAPRIYYEPSDQGHEREIRRRMDEWKKRKLEGE